jgi:hypothetical protein
MAIKPEKLLSAVLVLPLLGGAAVAGSLGITSPGSDSYPNPAKPVPGCQIKWNHPLATGLVTALPLNEGAGTNFLDAVTQQTYSTKRLSGTPTNALAPAWITPAVSSNYPWSGPAISNNGATAQAIQSATLELDFINNVTNGYSYAVLVQPLDTNTFGRIMDATGAAVITVYLNVPNKPGQVATTWRNSSGSAIVPSAPFTTNQWVLVLCTVQPGLGVMYLNGSLATNDTHVDLAKSWTNQTGQLVYNATGNGGMMANANFSSFWVWNNRVLTASEGAQMYSNPWAMFHSGAQRGLIKGSKIVATESAVLRNVSFYSHFAAGNVRLAIYDNGAPRNLLWQIGPVTNTASGAWITVPITSGTPAALTLSPGTYWLAWQVDTILDVPSYVAGASGDGFSLGQGFGPFPVALTGEQSTSERWAMYVDWNAVPAGFGACRFDPGAVFHLHWTGGMGATYSIEASTNLRDWTGLVTGVSGSNGQFEFLDSSAGGLPFRFYRALRP